MAPSGSFHAPNNSSYVTHGSVDFESTYTHVFRSKHSNISHEAAIYVDAYTGKTVKYGEMFILTRQLAWGFRNEFKKLGGVPLMRGDAIMLISPNSIVWPVIMYGCIAAGIIVSPANPAYTAHEMLSQFENSRSKTIVVHPKSIPTVLQVFKLQNLTDTEARRRIIVDDLSTQLSVPQGFVKLSELMNKGMMEQEEPFDGNLAHETTLLCYSSGTTGKPKGVETTHMNLNTGLNWQFTALPPVFSPTKGDVLLGFLPFFHIFGFFLINFPLVTGTPLVIMSHFDMEDMCKFVEQYKVTTTPIVPPLCLALSYHTAVMKYNMKSLKYIISGAAPLSASIGFAVRDKLRSVGANISLFQVYGLTETSSPIAALLCKTYPTKVGSVGRLAQGWELRLVADDERDAGAGEQGEIWVRGLGLMKGYLNNKKATENAINKDGWFKTGDIAIRDPDGYLFIVDRKKDIINYMGFQVAPAELEAVLLSHSDVLDAAVIGIRRQETEVPRAYLVRKTGLPITSEEEKAWITDVHRWLSSRVITYKYLRGGIVIVDALPKSPSGKTLRKDLKILAQNEMSDSSIKRAKVSSTASLEQKTKYIHVDKNRRYKTAD